MTTTSNLTLFDSVTTIPEVILVLTFLICIIPLSSWFVFIQDLKGNLLSLVDYLKKAYKQLLFKVLKYSIYCLLGGYLIILFLGYVSQTSVFEIILLSLCAAMPLIGGIAILAPFIINVNHRVKDSRKLGGIIFEKDISWNMICQTVASFKTDWGQSQYLELIRTNKLNVGDYSFISELPQLKGKRSEEQLARLREQILGLQE
jgi:hypothetical protein